ncbi:MAG TPA: hypothetical protein PKO09_08525 [Anaerolineae bacterium]|nr:hypothetical protein [Anaerolineae bacterium]
MTAAKVQLEEIFSWEFAQALREVPICCLPVGVLQRHGEHNAAGLESQTGQEVVPDLRCPHELPAGSETSLLTAVRPDLVEV